MIAGDRANRHLGSDNNLAIQFTNEQYQHRESGCHNTETEILKQKTAEEKFASLCSNQLKTNNFPMELPQAAFGQSAEDLNQLGFMPLSNDSFNKLWQQAETVFAHLVGTAHQSFIGFK